MGMEQPRDKWVRSITHSRIASYAILALGVATILAAYWPGRLNADSRGILAGVHGELPIVDQWTATLTWAWQKAERLIGLGSGGVLLIQTAAFTAGVYLVLRSCLTRIAAATCAILVLLAPPTFGFLGLVGRDAWFVAGCTLAVGMGVTATRIPGHRTRAVAIVFGVAMAALALAARQNALTAVAPILVALSVATIDLAGERGRAGAFGRRPLLAASGCGLAAAAAIAAATMLADHTFRDRALHPEVLTYLYDLGYLTLETDQQLIPHLPYTSVATQTVAEMRRRWQPHNALIMRFHNPALAVQGRSPKDRHTKLVLAEAEVEQISNAWREAVMAHPVDYLRGRWGLWRLQAGIGHVPGYARAVESTPGTYGYEPPAFPALSRAASDYAERWGTGRGTDTTGGAIHRAWIYLLVCAAGLLLALPRFPRAVRLTAALPAAALGLQLGLFFLAPAAEWRFQLLAVYAAMIVAILAARLAFDHHRTR